MQTFDQSIFSLYKQGLVTLEEALRWASNVDEFKLKVQGIAHDRRHGARRDGDRSGGVGRVLGRLPASVADRRSPISTGSTCSPGASCRSTDAAPRPRSPRTILAEDISTRAVAHLLETGAPSTTRGWRGPCARTALTSQGTRAGCGVQRELAGARASAESTSPPRRWRRCSATPTPRWSPKSRQEAPRHGRAAAPETAPRRRALYQDLSARASRPSHRHGPLRKLTAGQARISRRRPVEIPADVTPYESKGYELTRDSPQFPRVLPAEGAHRSCPARRSCRTTTRRCCSPTPA